MKKTFLIKLLAVILTLACMLSLFSCSTPEEDADDIPEEPKKEKPEVKTFTNPILLNMADPDVVLWQGTYYLYGTSYGVSQGNYYEVYSSQDLVNWEYRGICLQNACGISTAYWAPDVKERDGKFYMLFTAEQHIGMAVADSPLGPFVPTGFLIEDSIDGHIFFDDDGKGYIYYVSWREGHEYALYGCELDSDLLTPKLDTEVLVLKAQEPYECNMGGILEAPYMLKKDGVYYLTYSASHYESAYYCVAYATSENPLTGFVRYKNNPILVGDGKTVSGTGHHCITTSPDGKQMFILYHTHKSTSEIHPRQIAISKIRFDTLNKQTVLLCAPYNPDPQPYPLQ